MKDILKDHISGSRVTVNLLNGWIFPIGQSGEASQWRVSYQQGLRRLVLRGLRGFCKKNGIFQKVDKPRELVVWQS